MNNNQPGYKIPQPTAYAGADTKRNGIQLNGYVEATDANAGASNHLRYS